MLLGDEEDKGPINKFLVSKSHYIVMMNFMVVDVLLTVIVLLSYQSPLAETALRRRIR